MSGALGVVAGVGSLFGGVEAEAQASAQRAALQDQLKQQESATKQQQTLALEKVNSAMGNQQLIAAGNGYSMASTSLGTMSANDLEQYEQDKNAIDLSSSYKQDAIQQQIQNTYAEGDAGLAGGIIQGIGTGIDLYGNKLGGHQSTNPAGALASASYSDAQSAAQIPAWQRFSEPSYANYQASAMPSLFNNDAGS